MTVELLNYFGSDIMVADVARVSYDKEASNYTEEQNSRLIKYLADHLHTSPFRHPQLQFRIECPIYVERQIFKHEIGVSKNSISGRYVDFSDSYTIPTELRLQSKSSKQGSEGVVEETLNQELLNDIQDHIEASKKLYETLISHNVAKEQARIILPLCLNTKYIWTGSLQAFFHLCKLRLKPDAQQETRELVTEMLRQVKEIPGEPFKYSLQAFGL